MLSILHRLPSIAYLRLNYKQRTCIRINFCINYPHRLSFLEKVMDGTSMGKIHLKRFRGLGRTGPLDGEASGPSRRRDGASFLCFWTTDSHRTLLPTTIVVVAL